MATPSSFKVPSKLLSVLATSQKTPLIVNLLSESEMQRMLCACPRGTPPFTPALFEGTPLAQPRCASSSSLILGQLVTDLALESSGRRMTTRVMPKTYTHPLLALVLSLALPNTFGWGRPTWILWGLDGSVWSKTKFTHMRSIQPS